MKNLRKILTAMAITLTVASTFLSCKQEVKVTPEEAKTIAEEAYVFAYPMLMNYRSLFVVVINPQSPFYKAPFNTIVHDTLPADHTRKDVVAMNGDTPYSNFGMDLSGEPVVVSVPQISDRYYVMQFVDLYTHNFAFIGSRSTGNEAADFLFVGPKWNGEIPEEKFKEVFKSETNFVTVIVRTQLLGMDDLPNLKKIQNQYKIQTMSSFLGTEPVATPAIDWPAWNPATMNDAQFIGLFNFLLAQCQPINKEDKELMSRFAKIGIVPGAKFDTTQFDKQMIDAINEGVKSGIAKITDKAKNIGQQVNGWNMTDAIGPREFFKGEWLLRAATAQVGMYMNDKIEAFYPITFVDKDGETLNAKDNKYVLQFGKEKFPPAKYFWSVSLYDKSAEGVAGYMIENPINRYLINATTEGLVYNEDGGLTIYIQNEKPEGDRASNWLPAPANEFYLILRIYGPKESVMDGSWTPPAVMKVD
jgi:hypothetical protein